MANRYLDCFGKKICCQIFSKIAWSHRSVQTLFVRVHVKSTEHLLIFCLFLLIHRRPRLAFNDFHPFSVSRDEADSLYLYLTFFYYYRWTDFNSDTLVNLFRRSTLTLYIFCLKMLFRVSYVPIYLLTKKILNFHEAIPRAGKYCQSVTSVNWSSWSCCLFCMKFC